jgi:hypothetical protein
VKYRPFVVRVDIVRASFERRTGAIRANDERYRVNQFTFR